MVTQQTENYANEEDLLLDIYIYEKQLQSTINKEDVVEIKEKLKVAHKLLNKTYQTH